MNARETLNEVLRDLPEERLREVVDFARFLTWQQEREQWQHFGRTQFARAYGPDEPEYAERDLKPGLNQ